MGGERAVAGYVRKCHQQPGRRTDGRFLQQSEAAGDRSAWRIPRVESATDDQPLLDCSQLCVFQQVMCGNQSNHK